MKIRSLVAAALLAALTPSAALAAPPPHASVDRNAGPVSPWNAAANPGSSVSAPGDPTPVADNAVFRSTGAGLGQAPPELKLPAPRGLYQNTAVKEALTRGDHLVYGAELSGANPATAVTMTEIGGLCVLHFPATAVTASEVQGLAMAVRPSSRVVLGHFTRADDPDLKQKMDAGMHGAVLDHAEDPTEVRAFLDRLFFSPLGNRPGGPAYASGFLARFSEMVQEANDAVIGGVGISTARGVERIEAMVEAAEAGLTLVMVDAAGIARSMGVAPGSPQHRAALARVEQAARRVGVALGGRASSREEAAEMSLRGYRHVVLGSDRSAVREAFGRYENARREPARTPDRRPGEWNPVNRWLSEGRVAEVGFLMTPDLALARELATRTDALWIDAEHGPLSTDAVKSLLAQLPADHPVLVRVQGSNHPDIAAYLKAGARGIIAPNVGSAAEAAGFVARVKEQNPQATAVVMLENRQGLDHVDEIAAVPGIDVLHLGPYDLALSLRTAIGSEQHRDAVARLEEAARRHGVPLGGASPNRARTAEMARRGYGLVTTVSDQEAVLGTFRGVFFEPGP